MIEDLVGCLMPGRLVEIQGETSSGKTILALQLANEVEKNDGLVVYVDVDRKLNLDLCKIYVNIENLYVCQPSTTQELIETLTSLSNLGIINMIIIDSVGALVGKKEQSKEVARFLMDVSTIVTKSKAVCLLMNQYRFFKDKLTPMYDKIMRMYCTTRIKTEHEENSTDITVTVLNNKLSTNCCNTVIPV